MIFSRHWQARALRHCFTFGFLGGVLLMVIFVYSFVALGVIGCGGPAVGPWTGYHATPNDLGVTLGTSEEQAVCDCLAASVAVVTGDPRGFIARGGAVVIAPDDGGPISGLNAGYRIDVDVGGRIPDLLHSALAHELCHGALGTGDDARADACALAATPRCSP